MKKICCFAGHSKISNEKIKHLISKEVELLIKEQCVNEFWVGHYGDFDLYCASVIKELKQIYPNILLYLVIPYLTKEINNNPKIYSNKYDGILMAEIPNNTPKRFYISKCNEYMINNCDYLITYIQHSWGGASKTLEYAKRKKHIKIINLQ